MTRRLVIPLDETEEAAIAAMKERQKFLSDTKAIRAIMADWLRQREGGHSKTALLLAILDAVRRLEQRLSPPDSEAVTFQAEEFEK